MKQLLVSLLIFLALCGGCLLGVHETLRTIDRYYPMAWKVLLLERVNEKKKRADAAREKEAQK